MKVVLKSFFAYGYLEINCVLLV